MKILHIADVHIGSPLSSVLSGRLARERSAEILECFIKTVRSGVNEGAQAVIIAGDLFDSRKVSQRTIEATLSIMRELSQVHFFILMGNHDGEILNRYGKKLPQNLNLFNTGWTYYNLDDVTIAGRTDLGKGAFDTLRLDPTRKNIVVLHGEVRESGEGEIVLKDLAHRGIDYVALGHYHSYQCYPVDNRCEAVYSGAPEGRGFDECGEKGYVTINIENGRVCHKFTKNSKRILHTVRVDISGARDNGEWEWRVDAAIRNISPSDLVRVDLIGKYKIGLNRDLFRLKRRFGERFYHFEARDLSTLEISLSDYELDKSLRGEFVRAVLADTTLSEIEKGEIINCGLYALEGEAVYER